MGHPIQQDMLLAPHPRHLLNLHGCGLVIYIHTYMAEGTKYTMGTLHY